MSEATTYELVGCRTASYATDLPRFTVRATQEDPESWDRFAQACNATFRGAYWGAFAWQFRHHVPFVLRRYDIFTCGTGGNVKIGQFVIGIGWKMRVFGDILHVLPAYRDLWPLIMGNVLRKLGPAVYLYGSDWTTEPARAAAISRIRGAEIMSERPIEVYAVNFSDYPSWEDLHKSLNNNVRRNVASATRGGTEMTIRKSLRHTLRDNYELLSLKRKMFLRKGLQFSSVRAYAALASRICSLRKYMFTAKALRDSCTISLFSGMQFGRNLYYVEGASIHQPGGSAWFLLISMLRSTFDRSQGLGTCVLGPDEKEPRDPVAQAAWQNLIRQRLQCRAKPYPTSIVTFRFSHVVANGTFAPRESIGLDQPLRIADPRLSSVTFDRF